MNHCVKMSIFCLLFTLTYPPHLSAATERISTFTRDQQAEIGKIALDYLLEHPEYLDQLEQRRDEQRKYARDIKSITQKVLLKKSALLATANGPQVGSQAAMVALIEFYDYQCSFCGKMAPVVKQTVQENPQVRFIVKDWPAFQDRWPISETAAAIGVALWQTRGLQKYLDYHYGLFNTGHAEGQLKAEDIAYALKAANSSVPTTQAIVKSRVILSQNAQIAKQLGLNRLPTFIVMPLKGATEANTTILTGEISAQTLQAAIQKAHVPG